MVRIVLVPWDYLWGISHFHSTRWISFYSFTLKAFIITVSEIDFRNEFFTDSGKSYLTFTYMVLGLRDSTFFISLVGLSFIYDGMNTCSAAVYLTLLSSTVCCVLIKNYEKYGCISLVEVAKWNVVVGTVWYEAGWNQLWASFGYCLRVF